MKGVSSIMGGRGSSLKEQKDKVVFVDKTPTDFKDKEQIKQWVNKTKKDNEEYIKKHKREFHKEMAEVERDLRRLGISFNDFKKFSYRDSNSLLLPWASKIVTETKLINKYTDIRVKAIDIKIAPLDKFGVLYNDRYMLNLNTLNVKYSLSKIKNMNTYIRKQFAGSISSNIIKKSPANWAEFSKVYVTMRDTGTLPRGYSRKNSREAFKQAFSDYVDKKEGGRVANNTLINEVEKMLRR